MSVTSHLAIVTPTEWEAIRLSLVVAVTAVIVLLIPGIVVAWALARRRFPGHVAIDAVVHLPLVLPPVAIGYLLLVLLAPNGVIGGALQSWFGWEIPFTWFAAVIASATMSFPLLVRSARLGFEGVDPGLEEAAGTLGASGWRVFRTITLPLASPGILAGSVLAFARSLGEFGATIMIAGNIAGETRTLPLAIFTEAQTPGEPDSPLIRLVVLSVLLSLGALVVSELFARRLRRRIGGRP
ncbi:MAG: molybdate ABC transporter permease subunit [Planctomycetota bacterium]